MVAEVQKVDPNTGKCSVEVYLIRSVDIEVPSEGGF